MGYIGLPVARGSLMIVMIARLYHRLPPRIIISHAGARVTINNWKMSPRPKLKSIPKDRYPCCTTAKALFPRMPYVSKRRSSAHSAGRCHRSSSINLHVVDSHFTRLNWIPMLLVWSCTKISQNSSQENFKHGIFHGICPMHSK